VFRELFLDMHTFLDIGLTVHKVIEIELVALGSDSKLERIQLNVPVQISLLLVGLDYLQHGNA
jgi:hypothetical protein